MSQMIVQELAATNSTGKLWASHGHRPLPGGPRPAPLAVRVPNGLAWHPDSESCRSVQQCAAQRPSLPSLTVPIPPIGTLTPLAP
jgi:hypothetical protein